MPLLRRTLLALLALLMLPGLAAAQYPTRPVIIVVPFPAGGPVDGVARMLAQALQENTGRAFVVENRAGGAGGTVGTQSVHGATADGYTLLFNASIHVVQPLINRNVRYDVVEGFTHIALIASGPLLVSTHPSVPASTLREFFDALRREPARFSIATTGLGSAGHLAMEFLRRDARVDNEVVAYRGAGPALNDLIGGHIHLLADPILSSLPHARAGRLKALAITSAQRTPLAPDIPTVAESGMTPFEMLSWYGLWGPRGMSAEALTFMSREVARVVTSDAFRQRLAALGFEPTFRDGPGLRAFVVDEMSKVRPIVEAAGIRVE